MPTAVVRRRLPHLAHSRFSASTSGSSPGNRRRGSPAQPAPTGSQVGVGKQGVLDRMDRLEALLRYERPDEKLTRAEGHAARTADQRRSAELHWLDQNAAQLRSLGTPLSTTRSGMGSTTTSASESMNWPSIFATGPSHPRPSCCSVWRRPSYAPPQQCSHSTAHVRIACTRCSAGSATCEVAALGSAKGTLRASG